MFKLKPDANYLFVSGQHIYHLRVLCSKFGNRAFVSHDPVRAQTFSFSTKVFVRGNKAGKVPVFTTFNIGCNQAGGMKTDKDHGSGT